MFYVLKNLDVMINYALIVAIIFQTHQDFRKLMNILDLA